MSNSDRKESPASQTIDAILSLISAEQYTQAATLIHALTESFPSYAFGWTMLGAVCARMGQDENALTHMQRAASLSPDNPDVHSNLGNQLQRLGRLEEAEACLLRALQIKPDHAEAHNILGIVCQRAGRLAQAETRFLRALQINPDYVEAYNNLGVTLKDLNRLDEAEASCRRALHDRPDFVEAHGNLGAILMRSGRLNEAEFSFRRALQLKPDHAGVHGMLGKLLRDLGRLDEAVASYRRAQEIDPDHTEALYDLCNALLELGRLDDAVASYRRVLASRPDHAEAHNNLGIALKKLGRLDEAEASCRRALAIKPDYAEAHSNLGGILKDAGRLNEAMASDRRAIELDPGNAAIHSNFLYTLSFHPDFDERAILAEMKLFAAAHLGAIPAPKTPAARQPMPGRRMRIGYVSPDFRNHCQSFFTLPLLSHHDRTDYEIHCYAHLPRPDLISARLAEHTDVWRSTHLKSDEQLAAEISADGIDILVDLTMHMANGRPLLFARKPAPVQLAWLAYPGTTGNPAMDYRITDPWLDPPELGDDRYTETSLRLPDTFWCYDPLISGLQPNPLPASSAGHLTFGCLNNFCKISDDTLRRWGQVMARLPSSRLILQAASGRHRQRVLDLLAQYDIAAERIEFVGFQPRWQYLQTYQRIDICLDTLPYNGHTTSLDAYWMGVPVVSKVGASVVGRAGWSQLNNLGLAELAAFDDPSFIDIAVGLATDWSRLKHLRRTLRSRLEASPLMDGRRFAAAFEAHYRRIG